MSQGPKPRQPRALFDGVKPPPRAPKPVVPGPQASPTPAPRRAPRSVPPSAPETAPQASAAPPARTRATVPLPAPPPVPPATPEPEVPLEPPPAEPFLSRRLWLTLAVVGAIVGLTLWQGRAVYQSLKTWRAHGLVREAEALIGNKHEGDAMAKAQAAYQLSPLDSQTLRLLARLYAAQGRKEAIYFWHNLILLDKATADDRRGLGGFAVKHKELLLAQQQVDWLMKHEPGAFANLRLAAECAYQRGETGRAKEYCRLALAKEPADRSLSVLFARLLSRSSDVEEQVEARRRMRDLGHGAGPDSLEALESLARTRNLPREDAELTAERLLRHPLAKAEHEFLAADLQLRWHPEQRPALLAAAEQKFRTGSETNLLALGRWLNRLGERERTLECLPLDTALKSQDVMLVRLDALAALKRWEEIRESLEHPKSPLDPMLKDLFNARVSTELGHAEEAAAHWRRVHLEATDRPAAWLYIAQYAERIGNAAEAAKAWRRLAKDPHLGRTAYEALIRLAEVEGNTRLLRELMKEVAQLAPPRGRTSKRPGIP